MSISSVSIPVRRPQVAPAKAQAVKAAAPAPAAKAVQPTKPAQPVKAQAAAPKHSLYPIIASIGTGVSALGGVFLGMFACGMSDAPVSAFETFKMAGGAGLMVGAIGAAVFFGGGAIIRSLTNK